MQRRFNLSKLIRRTHLFLALFLTPWILMYALSTLAMHHRALFTGNHNRVDPGYDLVKEEAFTLVAGNDNREAAALLILEHLDLVGAFSARGNLEEDKLTVFRDRPIGSYRITYDNGTLRVEQQRFETSFFLEMLHRRRGYNQDYVINDFWAVIVDAVIVAILLWGITGLWMWWEMVRTRRLGALCLVGGLVFFAIFMVAL